MTKNEATPPNPFKKNEHIRVHLSTVVDWIEDVFKTPPTTKKGYHKWHITLRDGETRATLVLSTPQLISTSKKFEEMLVWEMSRTIYKPTKEEWHVFVNYIGSCVKWCVDNGDGGRK